MTVVRPQGETQPRSDPVHRSTQRLATDGGGRRRARASFGLLALLGLASSASALIIYRRPERTPCPAAAAARVERRHDQGGGATVTCTRHQPGRAHQGVLRHPQRHQRQRQHDDRRGSAGAGVGGVSATRARRPAPSPTRARRRVTSSAGRLGARRRDGHQPVNLTRTAGTATVVATGGTPANSANGDIGALFQITSGSSFTLDVDITRQRSRLCVRPGVPGRLRPGCTPPSAAAATAAASMWPSTGPTAATASVDSPGAVRSTASGANGTLGSCCTADLHVQAQRDAPAPTTATSARNDQCNGASRDLPASEQLAPVHRTARSATAPTPAAAAPAPIHAGDPCLPGRTATGTAPSRATRRPTTARRRIRTARRAPTGCSATAPTPAAAVPAPPTPAIRVRDRTATRNCSESCDEGADNCLGGRSGRQLVPPGGGPLRLSRRPASAAPARRTACKLAGTLCNAGSGDTLRPGRSLRRYRRQPARRDTITPAARSAVRLGRQLRSGRELHRRGRRAVSGGRRRARPRPCAAPARATTAIRMRPVPAPPDWPCPADVVEPSVDRMPPGLGRQLRSRRSCVRARPAAAVSAG